MAEKPAPPASRQRVFQRSTSFPSENSEGELGSGVRRQTARSVKSKVLQESSLGLGVASAHSIASSRASSVLLSRSVDKGSPRAKASTGQKAGFKGRVAGPEEKKVLCNGVVANFSSDCKQSSRTGRATSSIGSIVQKSNAEDVPKRRSVSSTITASSDSKVGDVLAASAKTLRRSWKGAVGIKELKDFKEAPKGDIKTPPATPALYPKRSTDGNLPKMHEPASACPKIMTTKQNVRASTMALAEKASILSADCSISDKVDKAFVNNKRLTNGSVCWDNLSSNLSTLGNEAMQRRDAASLAAAEALKEASAAESVIRGLSMFSELCSLAKIECPQSAVEQFLDLQKVLSQATTVADAFAGMENVSRETDVTESTPTISNELQNVYLEKGKRANLWVAAALSSDLAAFSLMTIQSGTVTTKTTVKKDFSRGNSGTQVTLMLEKSSGLQGRGKMLSVNSSTSLLSLPGKVVTSVTPNRVRHMSIFQNGNEKKRTSGSDGGETKPATVAKAMMPPSRRMPDGTASSKCTSPKLVNKHGCDAPVQGLPAVVSWIQTHGLQETAELAKLLRSESQSWFLKFMEGALDSGFQASTALEASAESLTAKSFAQQDNTQIAVLLSQLKRVNDWLDQVDAGKEETGDAELIETLARLQRKVYDFLLQHVESAAIALGNQANA